jgi:hypothetical protein
LDLDPVVADAPNEIKFADWIDHKFRDLDGLGEWHRYNAFRSGTRAPGSAAGQRRLRRPAARGPNAGRAARLPHDARDSCPAESAAGLGS